MKSAVLNATGRHFDIEDITIDEPRDREVLVQVAASGLCHSDLTVAMDDHGFPLPIVLGHEIAGTVRAVGDGVTEFAIGDRVVACPVSGCLRCDECRQGRPFRCLRPMSTRRAPDEPSRLSRGTTGIGSFLGIGGFAEQAIVHENALVALPDGIPFDRAALIGCGVATGMGAALNSARIRRGDVVVVAGCGGVGLNVIQGAALAGAQQIIALDVADEPLDLARRFGATDVVDVTQADGPDAVRALTGGRGATHAFEVSGTKRSALACMDMLRPGGDAFIIGVQRPGTVFELPFSHFFAQRGMKGVAMGSSNPKLDLARYAELYLQGRINLDDLVGRRIRLEEIDEGYEHLLNGGAARSVIVFD